MTPRELGFAALLRLLRDVRRDRQAMAARAADVTAASRDAKAAAEPAGRAVLAVALHHW